MRPTKLVFALEEDNRGECRAICLLVNSEVEDLILVRAFAGSDYDKFLDILLRVEANEFALNSEFVEQFHPTGRVNILRDVLCQSCYCISFDAKGKPKTCSIPICRLAIKEMTCGKSE